jgi:hypothetical protein
MSEFSSKCLAHLDLWMTDSVEYDEVIPESMHFGERDFVHILNIR